MRGGDNRKRLTRKAPQSLIIAVLAFAGLTSSFMFTLVVPIQAELPELLNSTRENTAWVVTSTLVAAAISAPISGRLGDMYGKRRIVLILLLTSIIGSLIAANTSELALVIVGRAMQGTMTGVVPLGISILRDTLHQNRIDTAIALTSSTMGMGAGLGMPLSAYVTEIGDWHMLFLMAAGLGALCFVLVVLVVPPSTLRTEGKFDYIGTALLSIGLVGVLLAVSRGNDWGWFGPMTLSLGIGGILVLLAWGWYELRIDEPLLDLRVASRRPVLLTNLTAICTGFAMFSGNVAFPQRLQLSVESGSGFGLSLFVSALIIMPTGIVMMVIAPIAGRLSNLLGPRVLLIVGGCAQIIAYTMLAFSSAHVWQIFLASVLVGMGIGFSFAGMPMIIMRSVPQSDTGASNGLNALFRALGTSTAATIVAVVLASSAFEHNGVQVPSLAGFEITFILAASVAALGLILTLFIPRRSAPLEETHPALPNAG
ncbi:MAG TPA: MFS transporter [Microbacteriaceae bacterium]|nr:MFS transporter [Microbacteriaceae bacterium]HQX35516.1 MFS transporter [Microbacteriaceae bacterium]HQZ47110.1 MFS transporter [Microbacteriaceae bacterium]HRA08010.1 MFS transporter [Microbacteriaceae bacterium]